MTRSIWELGSPGVWRFGKSAPEPQDMWADVGLSQLARGMDRGQCEPGPPSWDAPLGSEREKAEEPWEPT